MHSWPSAEARQPRRRLSGSTSPSWPASRPSRAAVVAQHPDLDCVVLKQRHPARFRLQPARDGRLVRVRRRADYQLHGLRPSGDGLPAPSAESGRPRRPDSAPGVHQRDTWAWCRLWCARQTTNASKAALHSFIMVLRQQMLDAGFGRLRIVEVFPPAVQDRAARRKAPAGTSSTAARSASRYPSSPTRCMPSWRKTWTTTSASGTSSRGWLRAASSTRDRRSSTSSRLRSKAALGKFLKR